jgi:hypothetical protein
MVWMVVKLQGFESSGLACRKLTPRGSSPLTTFVCPCELALQLFELVADPANLPLDLHCREGKDRCGTMSALLLLALGVSETDVVNDYVLSNALLHRRIVARMFAIRVVWILVGAWDSLLYDSEALAMIMRVHASWLETAIGQVGSTHFTHTQPQPFSFLHPSLHHSTKSAIAEMFTLRLMRC